MTTGAFRQKAMELLSKVYDAGESAALVRCMLEDIAGIKLIPTSQTDDALNARHISELDLVLERLLNGEPYQYITGRQFFAGQWFAVTPDVLIPRPETEELYHHVVKWCQDRTFTPRILIDHCTGSGCLAISLKRAFPTAHVIGTDISPDALSIAKLNAARLEAPVEFLQMDILADDAGRLLPETADIIVSNPPYVLQSEAVNIHPNVLHHEPAMALFVPDDDPLIFYRRILETSQNALTRYGLMAFEVNPMYAAQLQNMFSKFFESHIINDLSGKKRFLFAHKSR